MKKNKMSSILCTGLLVLAMILSLTSNGTVEAAKKKKPVLSRSQLTIIQGKKASLSLKRATGKVNWTTSNKKVVAIKSKKGKKKQTVILVAKKKGNCKITARIGKKKWVCKVKVLPKNVAKNIAGVKVLKTKATESSISVQVELFNDSPRRVTYGLHFTIQKFQNGKWIEIESKEEIVIPDILYYILPGQSRKATFTISETKEKLTKGQYRIVTSLDTSGKTKCMPDAAFSVNQLSGE